MTGRYSTEAIARVCHAANIELQRQAGDPAPSVPWDSETDEIRQSAISGVEAALKGVTPEELHAEWCRNKAAAGWRRGEFKDAELKIHPCLVPYGELPESERVKDRVFGAIVAAMSGGEAHACGPLLERAQEALVFERERADAAEAKVAKYESLILWGTSCASCGTVLDSCYAETVRREQAEAHLAALTETLGAAVTAAVSAERERIRKLADRNGAVCTGDEGTSCYFADLLAEPSVESQS